LIKIRNDSSINNIQEDIEEDSKIKKDLSGFSDISSGSKIKIKKIETNLNINKSEANFTNNNSESKDIDNHLPKHNPGKDSAEK
jgi:hypothetical protein